MSEIVLKTNNLTKYYGKVLGAKDVNLEVRKGEIYGFLGPNGAGKTTTIRMLLDFITPTSGSATIFDLDVKQKAKEIGKRIGYVPTTIGLYNNMTGKEFLDYFGRFTGVDKELRDSLIKRFKLDLKKTIKDYSRGNQQKVAIIQAFQNNPDLLFLDEPTLGLDPLLQQEFYNLLAEFRAQGMTIFISSHNLPEMERLCDRIAIIKGGKIVDVTRVEDLRSSVVRKIEVTFIENINPAEWSDIGVYDIKNIIEKTWHFKIKGDINPILKKLSEHEVKDLVVAYPSLEEIFLEQYNDHA